mmetsp:Transcript_94893/g.217282  ORF Transcript_94893/g.217282 Transcript_94893/m.217282 type:complete len:285 (+) Transcript_94893:1569-2423(+)
MLVNHVHHSIHNPPLGLDPQLGEHPLKGTLGDTIIQGLPGSLRLPPDILDVVGRLVGCSLRVVSESLVSHADAIGHELNLILRVMRLQGQPGIRELPPSQGRRALYKVTLTLPPLHKGRGRSAILLGILVHMLHEHPPVKVSTFDFLRRAIFELGCPKEIQCLVGRVGHRARHGTPELPLVDQVPPVRVHRVELHAELGVPRCHLVHEVLGDGPHVPLHDVLGVHLQVLGIDHIGEFLVGHGTFALLVHSSDQLPGLLQSDLHAQVPEHPLKILWPTKIPGVRE